MLFGKVLFCNSVMQSLSNGFPTHWFFLHELLLLLLADVWKAGHYTRMSSKTRTAIKFIHPQCWPQNYLCCPGSKMYSQGAVPSKTKGITACDQNRGRDMPSCNQEQQALMKPHAVTAFRLQIKLNHSAAEAEIRVNLWPLSQGISGWQTLKNISTFEVCRDRLVETFLLRT